MSMPRGSAAFVSRARRHRAITMFDDRSTTRLGRQGCLRHVAQAVLHCGRPQTPRLSRSVLEVVHPSQLVQEMRED